MDMFIEEECESAAFKKLIDFFAEFPKSWLWHLP